jgi:dimethylhistidine N-methyltransferase
MSDARFVLDRPRPRRPRRVDIQPLNFAPEPADLRAEVIDGLSRQRKALPCKLLYDERGSQLFNLICEQPEYYPTRTELQITRDHADEIAGEVGPGCVLVEYGSGSSLKTRILLDHLEDPAAYVPIDISREHLLHSSRALAASYPGLAVRPVWADYTGEFHLPIIDGRQRGRAGPVVAYFPGSTIGNFEPQEARRFLASVRRVCGPGGALLIGVDLKKDPQLLHAAYNDAAGVTASFNLNLLVRINRELRANFDVSAFAHRAFYNDDEGRVEMHLVSRRRQHVELGADMSISFEQGETIHTENCYKYTPSTFRALAAKAGYRTTRVWTDAAGWFSVHYLCL